MAGNIRLVPSGITLVDRAWGGFYRGGSYLLVGPRKSGRTSLALQFAYEAVARNEECIYFTTLRPHYLTIQAESVGIPLEQLLSKNLITVMRVVLPAAQTSTNAFAEYVKAIQDSVEAQGPTRIVFDELTPLVSQGNESDTAGALAYLTEMLESSGVTSLYVLGEAATQPSRQLAKAVVESMTGTICLQRRSVSSAGELPGGQILITPNIGHPEGPFMTTFTLEPAKQLQMDDRHAWSRPALEHAGTLRLEGGTMLERHSAGLLPPDTWHSVEGRVSPEEPLA